MFVVQKEQICEGSDSLGWTVPSMLWEAEVLINVPYREVIWTTDDVFKNRESRKMADPEILFEEQGMAICVLVFSETHPYPKR